MSQQLGGIFAVAVASCLVLVGWRYGVRLETPITRAKQPVRPRTLGGFRDALRPSAEGSAGGVGTAPAGAAAMAPRPVDLSGRAQGFDGIDSLGSYGFQNACIRRSRDGRRGAVELAVPHDQPENWKEILELYGPPQLQPPAAGYPSDQLVIDERFLYLPVQGYFNGNPQHCLNDGVVPVMMDYVPARPGVRIDTTRFTLDDGSSGGGAGWCTATMKRLGILAPGLSVALHSENVTQGVAKDWRCYREIRIPRRYCYRKPAHLEIIPKFAIDCQLPGIVAANQWLYNTSHLWRELRVRALKANRCMPGEGLGRSPCALVGVVPRGPYALVYDRRDAHRRMIDNPLDIVAGLQQKYPGLPIVSISELGTAFSPCQQAELFARAVVAVFPHGGHTANVMYMPSGSQVVEIFCGAAGEIPGISSDSYGRLMGLAYSTVHEPSCLRMGLGGDGSYMYVRNFTATVPVIMAALKSPLPKLQPQAPAADRAQQLQAGDCSAP